MKKALLLLSILFWACSSQQENEMDDTPKPDVKLSRATNCYMQVLQRDTFTAKIEQVGTHISGRLTFDNYQKDGSSGIIKGQLENDVLKLLYTFEAEGTTSVMEVYFKRKDNALIRGVGEMNMRNDTTVFTDPEHLEYPENAVMQEVPCETIE